MKISFVSHFVPFTFLFPFFFFHFLLFFVDDTPIGVKEQKGYAIDKQNWKGEHRKKKNEEKRKNECRREIYKLVIVTKTCSTMLGTR